MKVSFLYSRVGFLLLATLISCDNSTEPENPYDFPEPIDSVATNITLSTYAVLNDSLFSTVTMETEGMTTIAFDDPNGIADEGFDIYAEADGFYTELYFRDNNDTLTVDLDAIPDEANSITGVILATSEISQDCYYSNREVYLSGPDGLSASTSTDSAGRFGFGELPLGDYTLTLDYTDLDIDFYVTSSGGTYYDDFTYIETSYDRAPYIYLYPEQQSTIGLEINFVCNGDLTESEPPYNNGWEVEVTPEGLIDGQYYYLFYEAVVQQENINRTGWLLSDDNLESQMREMLSDLGFIGREIDDFVEFWLPRIKGYPYYAFYYQQPESIIELRVNPVPDKILRALFLIQPLNNAISIEQPVYDDHFTREGFTLVEWGVIGWVD